MKKSISLLLVVVLLFSTFSITYANPIVDSARDTINQVLDKKNEITKDLVNIGADIVKSVIEKFSDMTSHWSKEFVAILSDKKIIGGYPDGTFKPDNSITVAEFTKLILESQGISSNYNVSPWYKELIDTAKREGIIKEGEFTNYDRKITRGEMARMVVRGIKEDYPASIESYSGLIGDYNQIPNNQKEYVLKAYYKGIITGYPDGTFKAQNEATRAESAVMITRLIDPTQRPLVKPYKELSDFKSVPLKDVKILENAEFVLDRKGKPEDIENVYFLKKSDLPLRIGHIVIEDIEYGYDPRDWESFFVSGYVLEGSMGTGNLPLGLIYDSGLYKHETFLGFHNAYHEELVKKYPNIRGLNDGANQNYRAYEGEKFTYVASFARKGRFDYEDYKFSGLRYISMYNYYFGKDIVVFENFFK